MVFAVSTYAFLFTISAKWHILDVRQLKTNKISRIVKASNVIYIVIDLTAFRSLINSGVFDYHNLFICES
jgi:hypothetical protein